MSNKDAIDADLIIAMFADGELDRMDAGILDCMVNRRMSLRQSAKHLKRRPSFVHYRLRKMPGLFAFYLRKTRPA